MTRKTTHTIPFKRKREGFTNYKKRMRLLMSQKPRLVVRKGSKKIIAQIAEYSEKGDNIKCGATSSNLKKMGWNYNTGNTPAAYLTGFMIGKKAVDMGIKQAILDIGLYAPKTGSKVFAVLKGAVDAGLNVPHSDDKIPKDERIQGKHIAGHNEKAKDITAKVDEIKKKITG